MTQLPMIMQCSIVPNGLSKLWYGTLVRFLCSEIIDEGTTSIVCGFGQEGQEPVFCEFITLLKYNLLIGF